MRPLHDMTVIQIEITNSRWLRCTNCTRFVGHHRKPYFMTLDLFREAVDSLEDFPGRIGVMGGEPTLHPQFSEILQIMREKVRDRRRREFWTSGHKWDEYRDEILATFDHDRIAYTDHTSLEGQHHPLLVAAEDVIADKELMWELIDNCWVQEQWSASITPKGAFFCEIAAAKDILFDGPGGWPLTPNWWKKEPADSQEQVERSCPKCSAPVPLKGQSDLRGGRDGRPVACIFPTNLDLLKRVKSPRVFKGDFIEFTDSYEVTDAGKYSANWNPSHFRPFVAHDPEVVEAGKATTEA